MCWRSRWRSAVKRVRCSSASGRCNNSVMLLQPDVLYSSSEICLLPSCHSVSELYIWLCTLLLRRVCLVAMCCRSILFGHKYKCWYFSVSCTVLFDGTDMQKCTRSATFTLGVFYDRHAWMHATCLRPSTLDCPASTPCMQVACVLHMSDSPSSTRAGRRRRTVQRRPCTVRRQRPVCSLHVGRKIRLVWR